MFVQGRKKRNWSQNDLYNYITPEWTETNDKITFHQPTPRYKFLFFFLLTNFHRDQGKCKLEVTQVKVLSDLITPNFTVDVGFYLETVKNDTVPY